jgi:hypothetical protein
MMKLYLRILFLPLLTGLITSCFADEVQLESFDDVTANGWYDTRTTGLVEQAVIPAPVTEGAGSMRIHFEDRLADVWDVVPRKNYPGKIDLTPIANKALSFWIWSDLVGSSAVKQLIIYQAGNTARFDVPIASQTGWRKIICPISEFFYYPPDGDTPVDDFSQIDMIDFWCSAWPSGGNSIYIDDLRIISDSNELPIISDSNSLPRVEEMPNEPSPYLMRDWQAVTQGYVDYALDDTKTGTYLPLLSWITSGPREGMFNMAAYVGYGHGSTAEAINALPLIVSGTLAGYDMTNYNGHDTVTGAANMYYCVSQQMSDNNGGCGNPEFWYKMLPTIFLVQLADLYPNEGDLPNKVNAIADRLYDASVVMGGSEDPWVIPNYNHKSFNFSTMLPVDDGQWVESGSAAAFAWISYMAYTKSGNPDHLTAADWGMSYLTDVVPEGQNPLYEVMLRYGPITAARMNAELGRSYDLYKLLYWCSGYVSSPRYTYNFRTGWGTISSSAWGGYDCDGLAGSVTDSSGYAFAMNIFQSAGTTIPVVRYDSDYARAIGKWMLNLANAARLLYPSFLDSGHQYYDAWEWAIQDGYDPNSYIAYEGLRRYKKEGGVIDYSVTPYATGDNALRLGLYGSSSVGYLGGIVKTTNVEKILQWDCLKTDFYHDTAYPTYLYFNPYDMPKTVSIDTGSNCVDLYDTVSQTFLKTDTNGITDFNIPADSAVVIVLAPAGGKIVISGSRKLINNVVVDYRTNTSFSTCAQVQASPFRLAGDITGDCIVDLQDLAEFTEQWLDQGICLGRADIESDETVNFTDFGKLAHDWLINNSP